jgi:hypothetical protein
MIRIGQVRVVSLGVAALLSMPLSGCGGAEEESPPACAAVPGQATSATGGSTINNYTLSLGSSGSIRFTNDNGSFYSGTVDTEIAHMGPVCLASVVAWPGGGINQGYVPALVGDAYAVQFTTRPSGVTTIKYAKFVVRSYSAGVVTVNFVPSL